MKVSEAARVELRGLYQRKAQADRDLALYVGGVLDALEVPRDRYVGVDDETGELILGPEPTATE